MLETHTRSGVVLGTLLYLSPEQATGDPVDTRSDIFALGVLLYECITGHAPFSGKNAIEIVAEVIHFNPPPPSALNAHIPEELDRITLKAMSKEPGARYQSARDLRTDLLAIHHTLEDSANVRTQRISLPHNTGRSSTLITLADMLRRPRLSPLMVLFGLIVVGLIGWGIIQWGRPRLHVPTAEAQRLYDTGTSALRAGSFFQASKALQLATATDDQFALAHARLAEAWMELDYGGRAKDELLHVGDLTPDRSLFTPVDALYLDAVTATVRRDFSRAIGAYSEIARRQPDQPQVYVDLGRAFEKNNESDKAIESYLTAIKRDSQNATAYLRLGVLYGRQHNLAGANAALDKAETISQALGNVEARAEVAFQRGVLLNDIAGKIPEARTELEHAREIANVVGNQYQQIKILFQLSSVSIKDGKTDQAQQYAREAIALAQSSQMENLIARGSIDLGNIYLARGNYSDAEKYFQQGLEAAQRYGGQQNEARARLSLASLYVQRGESDPALTYDEQALAFYQSGGYRTETSQALLLRGRAFKQKGNYDAALQAFQEQLKLADETGDQAQIAYAHGSIGTLLFDQEKYSEALQHFEEGRDRYKALGNQLYAGYALMNVGAALWALGHYDDARQMLAESSGIARQKGSSFTALQAAIGFIEAEMSLNEQKFVEAAVKSQQALDLAGAEDKVAAVQGKYLLGLAQARSGRAPAGQRLCQEASDAAVLLGDPLLLAKSRLTLAEAALLSGDTLSAFESARLAQTFFASAGLKESEWRAWLIVGLASQKKGDNDSAKTQLTIASERLSSLQQKWGAEVFSSYLARPDVRLYRRQLDQSSTALR
jgi:tetratricopeptide (TPR) repeat protein